MAIYFPNQVPSTGQRAGEAFGGGISNALNALAQQKMNELQQRQQAAQVAPGLQALLPQQSQQSIQALSQLPSPFLMPFLKNQAQMEQFAQQQAAKQQEQVQHASFLEPLIGKPLAQIFARNPKAEASYLSMFGELPGQQQQQLQATTQQNEQNIVPQQMQTALEAHPSLQGLGKILPPRQQQMINTSSKKYVEGIGKVKDLAEETLEVIGRMRELDATGRVLQRATGLRPTFLQNDETAQYDKESKRLAGMLTERQGGVPTGYKIKFAESQKPNLSHSTKTRDRLLSALEKEAQRALNKTELANQLISLNNYQIPSNLSARVENLYKDFPEGFGSEVKNEQENQERQQPSIPRSQEESLLGTLGRGTARTAARVGESILGLPGDIGSLALGLPSYLTGGKTPTYEQAQQKIPILPPTSAQLSEKVNELTGGYTAPQNEIESLFDDITGLAGAIAGPGKLPGTIAKVSPKIAAVAKAVFPFAGREMPVTKALKMAAAGKAGSLIAENVFEAGPIGQTIGNVSGMLLMGIPDVRRKVENLRNITYEAAENKFGLQEIKTAPILKNLTMLKDRFKKQAIPHKEMVDTIINEVESGLKESGSNVRVNDLMKIEQGLNKRYSWSDIPKFEGSREYIPRDVRKPLSEVTNEISKSIAQAGLSNKEAGKSYLQAKNLHKGLSQERGITRWLEKHGKIPAGLNSNLTKLLFKKGLGAVTEWIQKYSKSADAFFNEGTQKHFRQFLKEAALDNSLAAIKELSKIDKIASSLEK